MPKTAWYVVLYIQNRVYNQVLVQPAVFKQLDGTSVLSISTAKTAGIQKFETRKCRPLPFGSTYKLLLVKVYDFFFSSLFFKLAMADFQEQSYLAVVYFS